MTTPITERIKFTPRKEAIKNMSTDEIKDYFLELSIKKRETDDYLDTYNYNRIFSILQDIRAELKSRSGDQRSILIPLISHPNLQVRLNASAATLAITPDALTMLRAIAALDRAWNPERGEALSLVNAIDEGRYIPT